VPAAGGAAPPHVLDRVERTVRSALSGGLVVAVALMAVGLALVPFDGGLPTAVPGLSSVVGACLEGEPAGFLTAGLLALVATPFVRVAGLVVTTVSERDWRFAAIAAAVLVLMWAGVLIGQA
jgi:uncharacterized membrane protein